MTLIPHVSIHLGHLQVVQFTKIKNLIISSNNPEDHPYSSTLFVLNIFCCFNYYIYV